MEDRYSEDERRIAGGVAVKFLCDTYALVELIKGNPLYLPYLKEELYTTIFNLYELIYQFLRDYDEATAQRYFYAYAPYVVDVKDAHLFAGAKFKLKHARENISYVDALGYALAQEEGMRFLTGDEKFETIENVEFVK